MNYIRIKDLKEDFNGYVKNNFMFIVLHIIY